MSTPEEPPQLTRRQLRELRNTAANQIITENPAAPADSEPTAPLPRAAEPVSLPAPTEAPPAGHTGERQLTRREVRQRERLRTASVPVITSDIIAAAQRDAAERDGAEAAGEAEVAERISEPAPTTATDESADADWTPPAAWAPATSPDQHPGEPVVAETGAPSDEDAAVRREEAPSVGGAGETAATVEPDADEVPDDDSAAVAVGAGAGETAAEGTDSETEAGEERRTVAPDLGADLLAGEGADIEVPASFDQLLTRGSAATGALSMPNALILSQTPESGPSLVSPITATGEVLITGTFALPDTYGSTGTVPGRSEGSDVDAVLVDGELPAASSPTPIAASAAISTIKSAEEIIKPPAPEKGSRLMVVLAITAGVLAVALAGVLIVAITTGVFR
ncbi:hypothetical protein [Microbacterium sp.]|uniref:hypothetical protein n=1 Tax=Microbacterium sp. TaxID=51671 RepID=UPI0039E6C3EE